jgi:hypothetical protein
MQKIAMEQAARQFGVRLPVVLQVSFSTARRVLSIRNSITIDAGFDGIQT